jgi:TolB-like protein
MATSPGPNASDTPSVDSDRLDSWKEIAAHLNRNVRTVQRWERAEGLPVHRHLHAARGSVYASAAELDEWWRERAGQSELRDVRPAVPGRRIRRWALSAAVILGVGAAAVGTWRRESLSQNPPRSIAVLPFKPLAGEQLDEQLRLGLTEALINQLGRIKTLRIEPLARVLRFHASDQDPVEAGRTLGVAAVLEARCRLKGSSVHVRARLLRTLDGSALAVEEWDEPFRNVLAMQGRLAQSIAEALEVRLTPAERVRIGGQDTSDPEAFRHYLFGRYHLEVRSPARMLDAEREFRAALALDPGYAHAHAGLSVALTSMAWLGVRRGIDVMRPAKEAAQKAVAIDESVALAHTGLAYVHDYFEFDPFRAQAEHLRAMELDDRDPWVLRAFASFLMRRDAFDEALGVIDRAIELDPTSPLSNRHKAMVLYVARRYDACIVQSRRTLTLDPHDLSLSYVWLARCLEQQGQLQQAIAAYTKAWGGPGEPAPGERPTPADAAVRWNAYWRRHLESGHGDEGMAAAHVRLNHLGKAMELLERAYEARSPWINNSNQPEWDRLRADPRFQALRARTGRSDDINARLAAIRPARASSPAMFPDIPPE